MNKLDLELESILSSIYYSNSGDDYDEYLNVSNDVEEIKQTILKAIMKDKPEIMMDISNDYEEGQKYGIEEFESAIKDLLSPKQSKTK